MSYKKIVPCLDFYNGHVVKGVHFENVREVGDAVENAKFYEAQGADELAFLDISATVEGRDTLVDAVKKVTAVISIPLCVGGGIRTLADAERIIAAGASKISINSAAVLNPALITECATKLGKERVVCAIDAKLTSTERWTVFINGGQKDTGIEAVKWARFVADLGAGEILLTSIDRDGVKNGYDIPLTRAVSDAVKIPVTASGGAGKKEDFLSALTLGGAQTALAASLFHFREIRIPELKAYLKANGVAVR